MVSSVFFFKLERSNKGSFIQIDSGVCWRTLIFSDRNRKGIVGWEEGKWICQGAFALVWSARTWFRQRLVPLQGMCSFSSSTSKQLISLVSINKQRSKETWVQGNYLLCSELNALPYHWRPPSTSGWLIGVPMEERTQRNSSPQDKIE